jgi:hypothetical protein
MSARLFCCALKIAQLQERMYHVLTEAGINADNIRVVRAEFRNTADET